MELLEREDALERLRACMTAAAGGVGRVVLVAGEAGIGKTSLMREAARALSPAPLWWGSCDALQVPNPLAPLHDIAHSSDAGFGRLLEGNAKPSVLFGEVIRELQALGPALVVIEDAHWADDSTLDFIRFVGRRIDRTQAVLAVTFRQDELPAAHPLRTVIGDLPATLTTRIDLPRLSPEAVATLAHGALRSAAGVHAATGGNPFFVTELLRHGSAEVPQSVQDMVLARFARLAPKARSVVQLAAIVPGQVERWLVEEMLAPEAGDLESCIDSGLILVDGYGAWLRFRHELARVAIESAISPPVAEQLHARALETLVRHGTASTNAARLAHHATHARSREAVLAYVPAAAAGARDRGAHREAAAHYRTALEYMDGMSVDERVGLLEAYAVESQASHRLCAALEAREWIARLLDGADDVPRQAHNLSLLALNLVSSLRNEDADATSRRAIALLEAIPPRAGLAHAYRAEAQLRLLNRDCHESVAWGEKAIALAARLGDHKTLAAAYSTVGTALLFIDYDRGVASVERGIQLALAHGHGNIVASAYCKLGSASGEIFHLRAAERQLQSAIRFSAQNGIDFYGNYALAWLGLCHLHLGRWDEAEVHATEALEAACEPSVARLAALCALGRLHVRRGDAEVRRPARGSLRDGVSHRHPAARGARAGHARRMGDAARRHGARGLGSERGPRARAAPPSPVVRRRALLLAVARGRGRRAARRVRRALPAPDCRQVERGGARVGAAGMSLRAGARTGRWNRRGARRGARDLRAARREARRRAPAPRPAPGRRARRAARSPPLDAAQCARAHRARGRDPRAALPGSQELGDRRDAVPLGAHRRAPRRLDPRQARGKVALRGGRHRRARRTARAQNG